MGQAQLPVLVGIQPGQQAGPGRAARRRGDIGAIETHPLYRQPVEMRRGHSPIPVAAQLKTEIIGRDQEKVRFSGRIRFRRPEANGRHRQTKHESCADPRGRRHQAAPRSSGANRKRRIAHQEMARPTAGTTAKSPRMPNSGRTISGNGISALNPQTTRM